MTKVTIEIEDGEIRVITRAASAAAKTADVSALDTGHQGTASATTDIAVGDAIDGGAAPSFSDTTPAPVSGAYPVKPPAGAAMISAGPAPQGM